MKEILIINGMGGVGKDTFVNCLKNYAKVMHISIVDIVKSTATKLGWNGEKDEKSRRFLSDLKVAIDRYNDANYEYVKTVVEQFKTDALLEGYEILCIDMREKEQVYKAKKDFGARSVLVVRDSVKNITSNIADAGVFSMDYDVVIKNNSTIDDLNKAAGQFVSDLRAANSKDEPEHKDVNEGASEKKEEQDEFDKKVDEFFDRLEGFLDIFFKKQ